MQLLVSLCQIMLGQVCFISGMLSDISTIFRTGNVTFIWTPSPSASFYDIKITRDKTEDRDWIRVQETQYTVRNSLLYDVIKINFKANGSMIENTMIYKVSKAQIQIGDPVNISWTAAFFPITGQYNVYHTYKVNKTIFQLQNEGILYGGHNVSNKYRYITRPYNSVNISFEIRHTTVDDAGYYAGGPTADSAWSGGGVVLIVFGKPMRPNIEGNLSIMVETFSNITCSSKSTSAPDYYTKLVTLTYTWFVNNTQIDRETNHTLSLKVTKGIMYNKYSCTATEEDLVSDRSDTVQINPLYGPEKVNITPKPSLNKNDQIEVRDGDFVGPFNCSADCNPYCNITWQMKNSTGFYEVLSENGALFHQVERNMEMFCCVAKWVHDTTTNEIIKLDVQYMEEINLYLNDTLHSNADVSENTPLRIACFVDGNPAPTIRLSRGNPKIDTSENFKTKYHFKSGFNLKLEVAVPLIANPPPQKSNLTWVGPYTVPMNTVISQRDEIYKQLFVSFIPVVDQTYFGNYSLQYREFMICTVTIIAEEVPQAPTNVTWNSYASGYVNLTWVSGFSRGPYQFFILSLYNGSIWEIVGNVSDPGVGNLAYFDPGLLTPGHEYAFRLESCNRINCSFPPTEIQVTIKDTIKDCVPGFYGERCENNCGKCNNDTTCNTASGVCPNDCQENWIPPLCADCKPHKYGLNCSFDCGHCKNGKPCSTASGACIDGCDDGWTGIQCDTVCSNGTYVLNGECIKCQGASKDNAPCNKSTGESDNERSYLWNGKDFKEDKIPRTYTVIIIVLAILLGITWLLMTIFIIFKLRRGSLQTTKTSIYLDTENVMESYQNLQNIEGETNYTNIDRTDHETQYVELDIS
uniref:Uncharacterized protein n=1 Tax=Magallana gigas TaxID=29159 RepID=A0A8W8P3S2_MAGGI